MKNFITDQPTTGQKLVALYKDGSGAMLLHTVCEGEYLNGDGEKLFSENVDDVCLYWIELPSDFKFWYEVQ